MFALCVRSLPYDTNNDASAGDGTMVERMWRVGIAAAFLMFALDGVKAAELPVKAPPVVAVPLWTGFYAGSNIGGGWSQKTFIDTFPDSDGEVDATPRAKGWVGGLQTGYNYQINSLLLGVEGDFTWLGTHSQFSCFNFGAQVCTADPEWMAALTGRVGVVFGPALIYAKGGPAWIRDTYTNVATQSASSGGVSSQPGDLFVGQNIRPGWTAGGGIEYMFLPGWSFRLEYDYAQFSDKLVTFDDGAGDFFNELIKQNLQMVTVGVNYYFGVPAAVPAALPPIVAKAPYSSMEEPESHILAFSGFDVGKWSVDGWVGALIAPWKDLDTSGPRFWISGGAGWYKYPAQGTLFKGVYTSGEVLAGYGFEGDNYSINVLVGPNAINQMVSPFDPDNKVQGTQGGVKVRADAYTNPTPKTMTYGEAEYSTAFGTYYASQRIGYDITNGKEIYVGPIANVFGDQRYDQWQVGAHISNLKLGTVHFDISAGFADDSVVKTGAFGKVEMSSNF
jgi:outer membrane immunogenic protein